jgi:hypothetical protein
MTSKTDPQATPSESAAATAKPLVKRFFVRMSKRGKKVLLTLNGGAAFSDYELAYQGALASRKRHKWTRIVIDEVEFPEGSDEGVVVCTMTLTPPKKREDANV